MQLNFVRKHWQHNKILNFVCVESMKKIVSIAKNFST